MQEQIRIADFQRQLEHFQVAWGGMKEASLAKDRRIEELEGAAVLARSEIAQLKEQASTAVHSLRSGAPRYQ